MRRTTMRNQKFPVRYWTSGLLVLGFARKSVHSLLSKVLAGADHKTNQQIIEQALKSKKQVWPRGCNEGFCIFLFYNFS